MYFTRKVRGGTRATPIRVGEFEHAEVFNVSERIYRDHEATVAMWRKTNKYAVADFAAAVFAALYRSGGIEREAVEALSHLCRTTIMQQGYGEATPNEVHGLAHSISNTVAIVPGCQNSSMLRRRVERAVDFAADIRTPLQIIFAGMHPPKRRHVDIQNEATRMHNWFVEVAEAKKIDISKIKLTRSDRETNSTDTVSNLNNILGSDEFLNRKQKTLLVIISSTFHLIRLGQHLNKCIATDKFSVRSFLDHIALVGAESPHDKLDRTTDYRYVKLMLFELYFAHMK